MPNPPANPANPPTPPTPPALPAPYSSVAPKSNIISPGDEPDHHLRTMIEKRSERQKPDEKPADGKPPEPKPDAKPPSANIGTLLAQQLKFREPKPAAAPAADPAKPAEPEKPTDPPPAAPAADPAAEPSIVKKPKAKPPVVDAGKIAADAAAAATRAAIEATKKPDKADTGPDLSGLTRAERRDFDAITYLAQTNPEFKGADKTYLENRRATEKYAAKWQLANPGKEFDPEDPEHDTHFSSLDQVTPEDIEDAKIEMKAAALVKKEMAKTNEKIAETEARTAQERLTTTARRTHGNALGVLVDSLGEDVGKAVREGGLEKLEADDPIVADAIKRHGGSLLTQIQGIIEIEDPEGRVRYDEKNPGHAAWAGLLARAEAKYADGNTVTPDGRTIITRTQYQDLPRHQRAQYAFITPEDLLGELIAETAEKAGKEIEAERAKVEKAAQRMGYVKAANPNPPPAANPPTPPPGQKPPEVKPEPPRPVSPAAVNGVPADAKGGPDSGVTDSLLAKSKAILFPRA